VVLFDREISIGFGVLRADAAMAGVVNAAASASSGAGP
jgi:hypothetical protein